jgi:4-hydroxybenzoate polyprenyltransferase
MFEGLSQRLLTVLQLTRMALVFTAIADSYATALMLRHASRLLPGYLDEQSDPLDPHRMLALAGISIGLYGFGMSLNDIADRRRDERLAAHRPIPSGRVGVFTAHALMLFLVLGALSAAAFYSYVVHDWKCLLFAVWTGALISFYDLAGKYLVAPGLLALGLIRFFHA